MGKRRIYFQDGCIDEAPKSSRKRLLTFNKKYEHIPYKFTPYSSKEIDEYWKRRMS